MQEVNCDYNWLKEHKIVIHEIETYVELFDKRHTNYYP